MSLCRRMADKFGKCRKSLRLSSIVVGVISIIAVIIGIVTYSNILSALGADFNSIVGNGIDGIKPLLNKAQLDSFKSGANLVHEQTKRLIITILIALVIRLVICALLLFGSVKRIRKFILPYICMGLGEIIYGSAAILGNTIILFETTTDALHIVKTILGYLLGLGTLLLFWCIAYTYSRQLQREEKSNEEDNLTGMSQNV